MVRSLAIRSVAQYLPGRAVQVAELPEHAVLSLAESETCTRLGIDEVRADDDLSSFELAAGAANRVLAGAGLDPGDLDALIVLEGRSAPTLMSSAATRLQAHLGADRAVAFSVGGLGCVSITPALLTARGLLAADEAIGTVLVAHGSKPVATRRYRHPVTVNGDGGQAVLLSGTGPLRILDLLQQTNGEYWDLFHVEYRDRPSAQWREECTDPQKYSFQLAIETRNRLRALHRELLERNGLRSADIACHVSQNLSLGSHRFIEETLDVTLAKACSVNLARYGHLGPNDVLLNLESAIEAGDFAPGQRAVVLNVSPVAAWSLLLVEHAGGRTEVHYL